MTQETIASILRSEFGIPKNITSYKPIITTPLLHVIVKELANTAWSRLPEELLRNVHETIYPTTGLETRLKTLTLPKFLKTSTGQFASLEITYQFEDVGLNEQILIVDEVFHNGSNITELLSEKALEDIANEAEVFLKNESLSA